MLITLKKNPKKRLLTLLCQQSENCVNNSFCFYHNSFLFNIIVIVVKEINPTYTLAKLFLHPFPVNFTGKLLKFQSLSQLCGISLPSYSTTKLPQLLKALGPIYSTFSGMHIFDKLLQLLKADSPMLFNFWGKVISTNIWQFKNASLPISFTSLPILILLKLILFVANKNFSLFIATINFVRDKQF